MYAKMLRRTKDLKATAGLRHKLGTILNRGCIGDTRGEGTIKSIFNETEHGSPETRDINTKLKEQFRSILYPETLGNQGKVDKVFNDLHELIESKYDYIQNMKQNMIPEIDIKDILNNNTDSMIDKIKETGVFVIRNVLDSNVMLDYKAELREYIELNHKVNGHKIYGFPEDNPQVYEIYWSKPQIKVRQDENMLAGIQFANGLWTLNGQNINTKPVMYCDRLRIRDPHDNSFNFLSEHLDSGSIERWQDNNYRMCYKDIFNLNWNNWDGYNGDYRIIAQMDHYGMENNCTVFRTFQGWLAMSDIQSDYGTLKVSPLLKESIAYIMLRPFVSDMNDWNFGEIFGGYGLKLKDKYHKLLKDIMVPIPSVQPGDMVFWHCDTIHAVDAYNKSDNDNSVMYIPACFDCELNRKYMINQGNAFINGTSPPDFPQTNSELYWENRATIDDLNTIGKLVMQL